MRTPKVGEYWKWTGSSGQYTIEKIISVDILDDGRWKAKTYIVESPDPDTLGPDIVDSLEEDSRQRIEPMYVYNSPLYKAIRGECEN
jgi:hypothetical protein